MRVTDRMGVNQVINNLQKNRTDMADLQNQAATQKRVTRPSDDPVAAAKVLGMRSEDRTNNQFIKNIHQARSFLEFTDQSLGELNDVLVRMKELAIQQANDAGASAETRKVTAEEVAQGYRQAIQIGNRKLGERFIFGGANTTVPPFTLGGEYQGDDGEMRIHINKEAFLSMNLPGEQVFLGRGVGSDGQLRQTAESPRSSSELDRYQQIEQQRRIDKEIQESGEGQVQLRTPATTDRGDRPIVRSEFDPNNRGINVLDSIKNFEIGLRVNDKAMLQDAIDSLDNSISQVIFARAQVGARIQTLNHSQESLQKAVVENKGNASLLEDADLFNVVSDMTRTDSTLKASLDTSGRLIQPSLLDFLK